MRLSVLSPFIVVISLGFAACSSVPTASNDGWAVHPARFFDRPFPLGSNPLSAAKPRISQFPNPENNNIVARLKAVTGSYEGFARTAPIYIPLPDDLVPTSGRYNAGENSYSGIVTTAESSNLQLLLVDTQGARKAAPRLHWRYYRSASRFHPAGLLSVLPMPGLNLPANARVLVLLKRGFFAPSAKAPKRLSKLLDMAQTGTAADPTPDIDEQFFVETAHLAAGYGVVLDDLLAATAFMTGQPTVAVHNLYDKLSATMPQVEGVVQKTRSYPEYCLFEGALSMPQRQKGNPPYHHGGGERVADNAPPTRYDRVPFSFAVPATAPSGTQLPLMIFIHGTAGLSTQLADRGKKQTSHGHAPKGSGPAFWLAQQRIAVAGAALPINPERVPAALGWGFYDFTNPVAIRDNFIQGALETGWFTNWLLRYRNPDLHCGGYQAPADKPLFRSTNLTAFGQSLGSIELALYAALDTRLSGIVPSGAGGHLSTMVARSSTLPGALLINLLIGADPEETIDELHPLMGLVQWAIEPSDPVLYAEQWAVAPAAGHNALHVYMPTGFHDGFFAPESQGAVAVAAHLSWVNQGVEPRLPFVMSAIHTPTVSLPLSPNLDTPDGKRIAALSSWLEDGILDGHHVSFQRADTRTQYVCFVKSVANGQPQVIDPATGCP